MSLPGNCSEAEPPQWIGPSPRLPEVPLPRPGKASLIGTVRDRSTDRPLAGGVVRVRGSQDSTQRETAVDSVGAFTVSDLPPGTYRIVTAAIPYRNQERTVRLMVGRVDTLRIALAYVSCWGY
jgi:hypothetical protein